MKTNTLTFAFIWPLCFMCRNLRPGYLSMLWNMFCAFSIRLPRKQRRKLTNPVKDTDQLQSTLLFCFSQLLIFPTLTPCINIRWIGLSTSTSCPYRTGKYCLSFVLKLVVHLNSLHSAEWDKTYVQYQVTWCKIFIWNVSRGLYPHFVTV